MIRRRVRVRFSKRGDLRFIGHRDLLRTLERLFRRVPLKLSMSEGFHPKPRMSFPSALAVAVAGLDEVMEIELAEEMTASQVLDAIRPHCPQGLEFLRAEVMPAGSKKGVVRRTKYCLPISVERRTAVRRRMETFMAARSHDVHRRSRSVPIDIRPLVESLELVDGVLEMSLVTNPEGTVRPREVLEALGVADLEPAGQILTRSAVDLES